MRTIINCGLLVFINPNILQKKASKNKYIKQVTSVAFTKFGAST